MDNPADKYIACVWKYQNGFRIVAKRAFKTEEGAITFANKTSEEKGVARVGISMPCDKPGQWGPTLGSSETGTFNYKDKEQTMAKAATKKKKQAATKGDAGEVVATKRGKKQQEKAKVVKQALDWVELLEMSDVGVRRADMKYRPALPTDIMFADNYCDAYARFLSGGRRTLPGSQKRGFTLEQLDERRKYVRVQIAKVDAGGKQSKPSFDIVTSTPRRDGKPKPEKKVKAEAKPKPDKKAKAEAKAKSKKVKVYGQVETRFVGSCGPQDVKPKKATAAAALKSTTKKRITAKQQKAKNEKEIAAKKAKTKAVTAKRKVNAKLVKTKKRGKK